MQAFSSCSVWASPCCGLSCCGARALGLRLSTVEPVAWGIFQTRYQSSVPCIVRGILNFCATGEVTDCSSNVVENKMQLKLEFVTNIIRDVTEANVMEI